MANTQKAPTKKATTTKPKIAFVTGATGFLGSHVARQLVQDENMHVRVLARSSSRMDALEGLDVEVVTGDLDSRDALERGMDGADWVFHVAASVNMWKNKWAESYRFNVLGTRNMVDAALKTGVKRFVYTSSGSTIGKPDGAQEEVADVDESTLYNLEQHSMTYPHTKWLGEVEVDRGIEQGLYAMTTHPSMILGPGDLNVNIGRYLVEAKKGRLLMAPDSFSNMCDVRDVARGHLLAAKKGKKGEHYVLTADGCPTKEFFAECASLVGGPKPLGIIPPALQLGAARLMEAIGDITGEEPFLTYEMALQGTFKTKASSEKAKRELGYTTRPWRESLADTYHWYKENGIM